MAFTNVVLSVENIDSYQITLKMLDGGKILCLANYVYTHSLYARTTGWPN